MQKTISRQNVISQATYTAIFLAITVLLPQACHLIGGVALSSQISPMHLPVYLCAILLGPVSAMAVGLLAPILSGVIFGMPLFPAPMLPMCLELMTYGAVFGLLCSKTKTIGIKRVIFCILSLIVAMTAGRVMLLLTNLILIDGYTISTLVSNAILNQYVGILSQILIVPLVSYMVYKLKK